MKSKIKFQPKPENQNGYPNPIKKKCFKCQKVFWIKFVVPQRDYSKKNSWNYYTGKAKDEGKYKCNSCLRKFYLEDKKAYLETIKDIKKRNHLRTYIVRDII